MGYFGGMATRLFAVSFFSSMLGGIVGAAMIYTIRPTPEPVVSVEHTLPHPDNSPALAELDRRLKAVELLPEAIESHLSSFDNYLYPTLRDSIRYGEALRPGPPPPFLPLYERRVKKMRGE